MVAPSIVVKILCNVTPCWVKCVHVEYFAWWIFTLCGIKDKVNLCSTKSQIDLECMMAIVVYWDRQPMAIWTWLFLRSTDTKNCFWSFFAQDNLLLLKNKNISPNVGLEPTTLRLRVSCSTDWASRALVDVMFLKVSLLLLATKQDFCINLVKISQGGRDSPILVIV